MKHEFVINGSSQKVALVPEDARDKTLNRLAFDGNLVVSMDLRDDGSLVFVLAPKDK